MREGAGEAVDAGDQQGITTADAGDGAGENGAGAVAAGGAFLEDFVAAGGAERVELGAGVLLFGRDAGVSDGGHGVLYSPTNE